MAIHICTGNQNKVLEFERILCVSLISSNVDLEEIQAIDTIEVCRKKAETAYAVLRQPLLVDDTGFELSALGGFPGALVTWAISAGTTTILHRMLPPLATAEASVITAVGYATDAGVTVFPGRVIGTVVATPRGTNGFGFDEVFVPRGEARTFAEMSDQEKDSLSPRGIALRALCEFLQLQSKI